MKMMKNLSQRDEAADKREVIQQLPDFSYDQMRVEFMRLSPSYELMSNISKKKIAAQNRLILEFYESNRQTLVRRKFIASRADTFNQNQRERILAGFEFIRDTYKEYGDVSGDYQTWLSSNVNSMWLTDSYLTYPRTYLLAVEHEHGERPERFKEDMYKFLDSIKSQEYIQQPRIVVSIPVNASLKVMGKDLEKWMQQYSLPNANRQQVRAKPLVGKRVHYDASLKKLHLLIYKTLKPEEPLWKLGLRARISERYNKLAKEDLSGKHLSQDDKEILSSTCSRALKQAQYISENAARGLFPLHKKIITPVFDYDQMRFRLLNAWPNLKA